MIRILVVGDIVGKPGRRIVREALPLVQAQLEVTWVIANAENAAGGSGLTVQLAEELLNAGVNVITTGDHVWKKKEILQIIEQEPRILRPLNFPPRTPGHGWYCYEGPNNEPIAVICLLGRVFMKPLDCPFRCVDEALEEIGSRAQVIFVDMHAEATSEKIAMGRYLDGRVTCVFGTHTHVATADECLLPNGTAYITDIGMTGPMESILGRRIDRVLQATIKQLPAPFEVAKHNPELHGAIIDVQPGTGAALSIQRISVKEGGEIVLGPLVSQNTL